MLMFRFWSSDSRGCEKTVDSTLPMPLFAKPVQAFLDTAATKNSLKSAHLLKRKRQSVDETAVQFVDQPALELLPTKRIRIDSPEAPAEEKHAVSCNEAPPATVPRTEPAIERVRDVIQFQMGLEILYKHDELRLVNQELAKCQIALEQLRRCHLIPYPVTCPTPEQMLEISAGKGAAARTRPSEPVPEWAPPFGVVDGPYARHYAKWLIPDPKFDGLPVWQSTGPAAPLRGAAEGRTTRNSIGEIGTFAKQRLGRGSFSHKLQSLSTGYPQAKDKAGPCVLKRSDGKTVKLVCLDCQRENFSSTQGFINHCRIAHKRDFKSHDEAAVACGHPIEVDELSGGSAVDERANNGGASAPPAPSAPSAPTPATGLVHPYARDSDVSDQDAYVSLESRLQVALRMYDAGKLPLAVPPLNPASRLVASKARGVASLAAGVSSTAAADAPYLSQLMKTKNPGCNIAREVADAKTREEIPDISPLDEDSDDGDRELSSTGPSSPVKSAVSHAPGVMRMPARAVMAPAALSSGVRLASSKSCVPHMDFETPMATPTNEMPQTQSDNGLYEDEMDVDLSPNTMTSNNAPSLVSDDGEYDDSDDDDDDDASSSDANEVTEIKLEDDHDGQDQITPRALRKTSSSSVGLKKDESRHVTFVSSPVRGTGKGRRRKPAAAEHGSRV